MGGLKGHFFDGRFHPMAGGAGALVRRCPADTDRVLWEMPLGPPPVGEVMASAGRGGRAMREMDQEARSALLRRFQERARSMEGDLARAIALETGKPLRESLGEARAVAAKVDATLGPSLARVADQAVPGALPGFTGRVRHRPLGVCLVVGPFNFPCHLPNTQILAALATGNSVVLKPSEKTALAGQLLVEALHGAGFPPGAVNLVQGDGSAAAALLREPDVKGVFFTGSREVGRSILRETSGDLGKLVALELGGKNTALVLEGADLGTAVEEIAHAAYATTGQRCVSVSNVAVHRPLAGRLVQGLVRRAGGLVADHPIEHEREPFMGPLVDGPALARYLDFLESARKAGLREALPHRTPATARPGHYAGPSVWTAERFDPSVPFLTEEVFGPCCAVVPFDRLDDAIAIANATDYGLAACVFGGDAGARERCAREIEAGVVNFDRSTCGASPLLPFGGVKDSGNHRPAAVRFIDHCVWPCASLEPEDGIK